MQGCAVSCVCLSLCLVPYCSAVSLSHKYFTICFSLLRSALAGCLANHLFITHPHLLSSFPSFILMSVKRVAWY